MITIVDINIEKTSNAVKKTRGRRSSLKESTVIGNCTTCGLVLNETDKKDNDSINCPRCGKFNFIDRKINA